MVKLNGGGSPRGEPSVPPSVEVMLFGTGLSGLGSFALGPFAVGPFAAGGMLLWGLVALLPILLHLLRRRRSRTVSWGAMQFLQAAIARRAQQFQFWRLLLLCLRVAAVLMIAGALARPVLQDAASQGDRWRPPPRLRVLVLDTSYSMQTLVDAGQGAGQGAGQRRDSRQTRFAAAQAAASEICRSAAAGDGFLLFTLSDPPQAIIPTVSERGEPTRLEIQRLAAGEGRGDLPATLAAVEAAIGEAVAEGWSGPIDVILFSDLQRSTWQSLPDSPPDSPPLAGGDRAADGSVRYLVWDAAGRVAGDNATVGPLERDASAAAADDSQVWLSPLAHSGGEAIRGRLAQLLVDGHVEQSQTFDLDVGGSRTLLWSTRLAPGRHAIEVRLGDDALVVDNRSRTIAEISPKISVAAFAQAASDTRYFALAAAPEGTGPVEVRSFALSQLPQTELGRFDVWVLCDPMPLGDAARRRIDQHLGQGGGVVWWLGPNWRSGAAAEGVAMRADAAPAADPVPAADPAAASGWLAVEPREVDEPNIDPLGYRSGFVQPFEAFPGSGLLSLPVFRYWTLRLGSDWQPAVAIGQGDPLIASLAADGRGREVLVATPPGPGAGSAAASDPWNALIAWPSFVPLVQEIIRWADAGERDDRRFVVGERVAGQTPEPEFASQLRSQAGAVLDVQIESRSGQVVRWTTGVATQAGFYAWDAPSSDGRIATPVIAVNVDPGEGRLEKRAELPPPWKRFGESRELSKTVSPEMAPSESAAARSADEGGRELFWWLLFAALGLLVGESLVVKILEGRF